MPGEWVGGEWFGKLLITDLIGLKIFFLNVKKTKANIFLTPQLDLNCLARSSRKMSINLCFFHLFSACYYPVMIAWFLLFQCSRLTWGREKKSFCCFFKSLSSVQTFTHFLTECLWCTSINNKDNYLSYWWVPDSKTFASTSFTDICSFHFFTFLRVLNSCSQFP